MREIIFLINSQYIELNNVTVFLMYWYIYVDHSNLLHCWAHGHTDTNSTADSCQPSAEVNLRSSVLLHETQPRSIIDTKIRVTDWLRHIRRFNDKIKFDHSNINDEHTALSLSDVH